VSAEPSSCVSQCRDILSIAEISARLDLPLGVTRVLVGDMADGGLVMVHRPTMTATAPTSPSWNECCTACGPSELAASSRAGYRRRCQRGDGRAAGDPVERVRGLRVRIFPLPRAQPRVRPGPGDHDAARGRHHDPHYLVWNGLGLTDTHVALWAHNLFSSAYIFLLRQFFLAAP
jgi:hypothetical protein